MNNGVGLGCQNSPRNQGDSKTQKKLNCEPLSAGN